MAEQKNTALEKNLINLLQNQLLPQLKAQKESENQAQRELENKLRALLKNKQLLKSLSEAQKNTLVKAANGCPPSMFDKLWTKVSTILNGLLQRTDKSPESVEKITEINRIIYHSLIHPNSNDLANIDVLVTTKGLKWQDDLDAVDNQFALLKLAATSKPVKRELVTTNKERITYKKREPTGPATATAANGDAAKKK
jgi:hypothetical protein